MIFSNSKVYDALKWVAQILLPAVIALYTALGTVWGLPYVEQVAATLAAIDTFMGAVLSVSSDKFHQLEQ